MSVKMKKAALLVAVLGVSTHAAAVTFEGDFTLGRRWTKMEPKADQSAAYGMQAHDYSMAAHVLPMPVAPVAFGLRASLVDFKNTDVQSSMHTQETTSAFGYEIAPEMKAWVPSEYMGTDILSPYIKLSFTFDALSNYKFETKVGEEDIKQDSKVQGFQFNLGSDVKVTENFGALVEYSYTNKTMQPKKGETQATQASKSNFTSNAFLLGARVTVL